MIAVLFWAVGAAWAIDAHGFVFEGVAGDVEEYARMGYPTAGVFGDTDVSLILDYARDPLTEIGPDGRVAVLESLGTMTLSGAFSFGGMRLEAALPYHPIGLDPSGGFSAPGDARFGAAVPLPFLGPKLPILGMHAGIAIPTGDPEHYVSAESVRFRTALRVAQEIGPVGWMATAGVMLSRPEEDRNLVAGIGPVVGVGASVRFREAASVAVEFTGESEYLTSLPIEATLSGRYRLPAGAWATAGAATGLTGGVGSSRWRLFAGAGWSFGREPEEAHIAAVDPMADRDRDDVPDGRDACPDQPETYDTFADTDGCPEPDGDQDGVPFGRDRCPDKPIRRGQDPAYSDGCPRVAELSGDRIRITEAIFFEEGKSTLMPASEGVLTAVWEVLMAHPEAGPILISGHTNSNGSEAYNQRLSDARAFEVMRWLAERGVDPARLMSKGYGEAQPLVPDTDPEAQTLNRRVEFRLLPAGAVPDGARQVDPATLEPKPPPVAKAASGSAAPGSAGAAPAGESLGEGHSEGQSEDHGEGHADPAAKPEDATEAPEEKPRERRSVDDHR